MTKDIQATAQKTREDGKIMQINVNSSSTSSLLARVENLISHNSKFYIVTPNPELILMAQTNKALKNALNSADISIPDGVGLKIADPSLKIIKGREFFSNLIELANENNWRVFLLGGLGSEAEVASHKLQIENPKLQIKANKGPILDINAEPVAEADRDIEKDVIDKINKFNPNLLFVAFGNPKQEIWININLSRLNIGGAMAVGGSFRYVAGLSKLPPKWMDQAGLEWLWRLVTEPKRAARVFNAVIMFPLRYFFYRFNH